MFLQYVPFDGVGGALVTLRSLIFAAVATLCASSTLSADEWAYKMFDTVKHDFGKVARGAKVEFHFNFRNLYVEDVHVASVRTSCGCTSPRVSKELLKTYDESSIVAHFNTDTFLGQRGATLTVVIDKPFYAEVQLRVDGYIRSDIVLNPPGIDFGTLDLGQDGERDMTVSYAGRNDWQIHGVKTSSEFIEAEAVELNRGGGQTKYELKVRLKPNAPAGFLNEQIVLLTNDARAPELPVSVEGKLSAPLVVSPSSLFLGIVQPGQKVTKQLVVQGKRPFRITGVTASDACLECKASDSAKLVHLVPITFTAGSTPGNVNYQIEIATDLGEKIIGEVTAYAQVTPPPGSQAVTANTRK
jgi:hypothetical protein